MNKKQITIIILAIVAIAAVFVTLAVLRSPEDSWVCTETGWQKHGQPSTAMPSEPCGKQEVVCPANNIDSCPTGCSVCPPCLACSSLACRPTADCEAEGFSKDWYDSVKPSEIISSFSDCVSAGFPVMESYPRQCSAYGRTYTEEIDTDKSDLIILDSPQPEAKITSPLKISGKARGSWFFEASFPVVLTNWDGLIIAQGIAEAQGDWMTEDFVPFTATLKFEKPSYGERGALILQKDNPSGLPENDDALEITVFFE